MPQGGVPLSVSSFQIHNWLGNQQDYNALLVLSGKSLMIKYMLAIGLTDNEVLETWQLLLYI